MINQVRQKMKISNMDTLWVTDTHSIEFLTKFHCEVGERFIGLCITQKKATLVLNHLFEYKGIEDIDVEYYYDFENIHQVIENLSSGVVGVDKYMAAKYVLPLSKTHSLLIGSDCVDSIRAIKNEEEIHKMIEASKLNDYVMSLVPSLLKEGVSEIEVAKGIEKLFHDNGADGLSFQTIIAFGEHGADPHAVPSDRRLKKNESVIVDMGCVLNGYCSDMTRTFFLESNPIKEVYDTVLRANTKAIESIKAGSKFSDVDKVARSIIEEAGYGVNFNHRLGHGIGKEVHEPYDVSASNDALIEPGMCFSIEPGIYVKDKFGIRIEDLVYVNQEGVAVLLNNYSKKDEVIK